MRKSNSQLLRRRKLKLKYLPKLQCNLRPNKFRKNLKSQKQAPTSTRSSLSGT